RDRAGGLGRRLSERNRADWAGIDRARRDERAAAHRGAFRRLGGGQRRGGLGARRLGLAVAARERWDRGVLRQDRLSVAGTRVARPGIAAAGAQAERRAGLILQ